MDTSKTGINETWAQAELTKASRPLISIPHVPADAEIPRVSDDKEEIIELQREIIRLQKELIQKLQEELRGV